MAYFIQAAWNILQSKYSNSLPDLKRVFYGQPTIPLEILADRASKLTI